MNVLVKYEIIRVNKSSLDGSISYRFIALTHAYVVCSFKFVLLVRGYCMLFTMAAFLNLLKLYIKLVHFIFIVVLYT